MKRLIPFIFSSVLFALLIHVSAYAADKGKELTKEESALWNQMFDDEPEKDAKQSDKNKTELANISGSWVGYYEYDKPQGRPDGIFNAVIVDIGNEFGITFLEPRNHPKEYAQLAANYTAKRQGKYIEFVKVYSHNPRTKIQYNLTISHDGSIMSGTWKIDDNTYGRAFFYRVHLKDLQNIKAETVE